MHSDAKEHCKNCSDCLVAKNTGLNKQPLSPIMVGRLFDCWTIDILKLRPDEGNNQILVCIKSLSKLIEILILNNHTALTLAECLFTLCSRFGAIRNRISDRGGEMHNAIVKHFCLMTGCHKIFASSYKPGTSGIAERDNRTILQRLRVEQMGKQNGHN